MAASGYYENMHVFVRIAKQKKHPAKWTFLPACLAFSLLLLTASGSIAWDYAPQVNQLLDQAGSFYDAGNYGSARMAYNQALQMEPHCADAYNGLGLCEFKDGNIRQSCQYYIKAIGINREHYNANYNLANNYYIEESYPQAITYYLAVIKIIERQHKSPDADLFSSLANVYRDRAARSTGVPKQKDEAMALDFYNRALAQDPKHFKAHANLGRLYLDCRQFGAAERELRKAIEIQPKYAFAYFQLGHLYSLRGENPAALVAFYNSLKVDTFDAQKKDTEEKIVKMGMSPYLYEFFAQGFEDLSLGDLEKASAEFQSAADRASGPRDAVKRAVALNNLGYTYSRTGNMAQAIDSYQAAIKLSPHGQPQFYYNLGQAYLQLSRLDEAESCFKTCLAEAKGNHYLAHNALGIVFRLKSEKANPQDTKRYLNDALKEYTLALMQSSDALSVASYNRGIVLEKLGQKAEAKESFKRYLISSPSGSNAAAAKERLAKLN